MNKIIDLEILDVSKDNYTISCDSYHFGRMFDNRATALKVYFPIYEKNNNSRCKCIFYDGPNDTSNILDQYPSEGFFLEDGDIVPLKNTVTSNTTCFIKFEFWNDDQTYFKNTELFKLKFGFSIQPKDFIPEPKEITKVETLWSNAHAGSITKSIDKEAGLTYYIYYNEKGEEVDRISISDAGTKVLVDGYFVDEFDANTKADKEVVEELLSFINRELDEINGETFIDQTTISSKFQYLKDTKNLIKNSIILKKVEVADDEPFRNYYNKINNIQTSEIDENLVEVRFLYRDPITSKWKVSSNFYPKGSSLDLSTITFGQDVQENPGENPGLIFQEWNHTNEDLSNLQHLYIVSATYKTIDDRYYFYITVDENAGSDINDALTVPIYFKKPTLTKQHDVLISWGDGYETINTSTSGVIEEKHKYNVPGNYTITIEVLTDDEKDELVIGNGSNTSFCLFGSSIYKKQILKKIFLSGKCTNTDRYICNECYNVVDVSLPKGFLNIADQAFYYTAIEFLSIPKSITSIGQTAFAYINRLKHVSFPNSTYTIGNQTFISCDNIVDIVIPKNVSLDMHAFANSYSLKSIIYESVHELKTGVFSNIRYLEKLIIGDGVSAIGNSAFSYMLKNKNIQIPDSVNTLTASAFTGCTAAENIKLSENITSIPASTFEKCLSLKSITIPKKVNRIEAKAFLNMGSLKEVIFECETIPTLVNVDSFYIGRASNACNYLMKMWIPDELYDEWITSTNWTFYANQCYKKSERSNDL